MVLDFSESLVPADRVEIDCGANYCTVNVALMLVTLPTVLVIVTEKRALLSAKVVAGVVYAALVAPVMFAPFFVH